MRADFISREELEIVLRLLRRPNRLVCLLCSVTGLRVGDVVALRTADFKQRMTVREAKTGKSTRVYIPKALFREVMQQAGAVWVFEGRYRDRHRTRQAVWQDLKRAARAFRLPQNVSVHSTRKLFAVELLDAGYTVEEIQRTLNHTNPETTLLYLMARIAEAAGGDCQKAGRRKKRNRRTGRGRGTPDGPERTPAHKSEPAGAKEADGPEERQDRNH